MRIYIIRHAEPDYPNNTITPAGHLEAAALAKRLAKIGLDRIYVSPLGRALHTMQYTVDALKMPYTIEPWTIELEGCNVDLPQWGRTALWNVPGEVIRAAPPYPTWDNWRQTDCLAGAPLPASVEKLRENSDHFMARHGYEREGGRYRVARSNAERIAVFCHGGFGLAWLAHLLELPLSLIWTGFWLAPSSVTTVSMDERSKQWAVPRCLALGDVSHLHVAELPAQGH